MNFDFADILLEVLSAGASDLHLTVGAPPMVRERGKLRPLDYPKLTSQDTREIVYSILNNDQRKKLENEWQIDLSYSVPGRARFRVNAYFQRASIGAVLRTIPQDIPKFETLGLPDVLKDFTRKPRGFVLVTGPTGSGKSTTLASMIDMINEERHEHIMTVEDPIEFLHRHKNCVVNQRELGSDAQSFAAALKSALRQDPDVILVGEMRDLETMSTAITAAETGHLVFATLHTQDTAQTIDRIVDSFPPAQQHQVRTQLSIALQGVVTQQLIPTADGTSRVCATEVMVPTPAVRNLIREGKTHQLYSALQTGGQHGMQTMDSSLAELVRKGKLTHKQAESRSSTPEELRRLLEADGSPPAPLEPTLAAAGPPAGNGNGHTRPSGGAGGISIGGPNGPRGT
jgi:twitching motility protein PilT